MPELGNLLYAHLGFANTAYFTFSIKHELHMSDIFIQVTWNSPNIAINVIINIAFIIVPV